jgi:hypothetical protein
MDFPFRYRCCLHSKYPFCYAAVILVPNLFMGAYYVNQVS